ncbi:hypothetical protein AcV7_006256 [Taiwanofungus camphoratus]|nr:hypothetical protein AcV7_006256 [Antrodia cinnamomea]
MLRPRAIQHPGYLMNSSSTGRRMPHRKSGFFTEGTRSSQNHSKPWGLHVRRRKSFLLILPLLFISGILLLYSGRLGIYTTRPRNPSLNGLFTSKGDDIPWKGDKVVVPTNYRPPTVDRTVMHKLHTLQTEDYDIHMHRVDGQKSLGSDTSKPRWPPTVTALPESRPTSNDRSSKSESDRLASSVPNTEAVDTQFCHHTPCRLLVPLAITEREPKAQAQLLQLSELARALNRTLILPNVSRGRLGTCLRWDYSVYFDIASLVRIGGAPVMMMDDFRTWVEMRPLEATGRIVSIREELANTSPREAIWSPDDALHVYLDDALADLQEGPLKSGRCLKSRFRKLDLTKFLPLNIRFGSIQRHTSAGNDSLIGALVNALLHEDFKTIITQDSSDKVELLSESLESPMEFSEQVLPSTDHKSISDPDVLLLHWDLHQFPFLLAAAAPLEYSAKLWRFANKLTASRMPYLAVYWHIEKVSPIALPACADALVDSLDTLLHEESLADGIKTVWLLSDHPELISGPGFSSDLRGKQASLRAVKSEHREAMDVVKDAFTAGGELAAWQLTSLTEEMARIHGSSDGGVMDLGGGDDEVAVLEDQGVVDILEKMVAMKAALFVTSIKGCGAVSTSIKQIADLRTQARTSGVPRKVVSYFG